ncbi:MAG: DUF447 family protein [Sulfolobales archaeon]|nr:DUF447 family protein [Sulfolobales archaeon]MCX8199169.1 DUF447 family protein [Sulfolobales archaeon]MDW8170149.1 DUF447 family protein [Desulfurococcaceae archaeon]
MSDEKAVIKLLRRMGFTSNTFLETIALVLNGEGNVVNVLPLGIKLSRGRLYARVFKGSRTYEALKKGVIRRGVICITQDAKLFYLSIFKKNEAIEAITEESACDAAVDFNVDSIHMGKEYIAIYLKPIAIRMLRKIPRGFSRAPALIIEALVWLTKLPYVDEIKRREYISYIRYCIEGIYRSSKSRVYRNIAKEIYEALHTKAT